ncbi:hypothetical protein IAR55_003398 [Kwoniella newhampshirensis]|uniref:GH18 domain-containing protein n=1 Tax=Kwoniella newhampshirensis TaxID=1651941 RepID=A0AAW0YMI5_9TREE
MSITAALVALLYVATSHIFLAGAVPHNGVGVATHNHDSIARGWGWGNGDDWSGYRSVGYFTNWAIYDPQDFFITNITAKEYTHILYAFANVDGVNGTVYLSDDYADLQYEYPGDDEDAPGNNMYGNLKQLFLMKEQNRNLKVLLSIGGSTYSSNFANITDKHWRNEFAKTSVKLLQNLGFDGLDIDYVDLFRLIRRHLDKAAEKDKTDRYLLSWAASCGEDGWSGLDVPGMDQYMDFWNLMAYDFSGSWTSMALPATNLYPDGNPANDVGASGSQCVQHYIQSGVAPRKLNLGTALYGTAFNGTHGMYTNWTDLGGGDWGEPGNYDDKHLPLEGEVITYNETLGASWSYNNATGHVTSFDIPAVVLQKAKYVLDNQLGGMMFWSVDEDYSRLQSDGQPSGPHPHSSWPWWKGPAKKVNYGPHKGAPWPLPAGMSPSPWRRDESALSSLEKRSEYQPTERSERDAEIDKRWALEVNNGICLNIGESLVDVAVTAFQRWGGDLDKSWNSLSYPHSEYDNLRNGFH